VVLTDGPMDDGISVGSGGANSLLTAGNEYGMGMAFCHTKGNPASPIIYRYPI
jgi:hypothetical protein